MKKHILKKSVSLLIAAVMLLALSLPVAAEPSDSPETITPDIAWITENTGADEEHALIIDTPAELLGFASKIGTSDIAGKYIKLGADIDLNPGFTGESEQPTNVWTQSDVAFSGTFDGNNHTVSGIYLKTASKKAGIFGGATAAGSVLTIKNLAVVNSYVAGNVWGVGGLLGAASGSTTKVTLEGIYVDVNVATSTSSGDDCCGGIIGSVDNSTTSISNCVYAGEISATRGQRVGGFIGDTKNASTNVSIRSSAFYGSITANRTDKAQYISGLIGVATSTPASLIIDNCIGAGSITFNGTFSNSGNFMNNSNANAVLTVSNSLFTDMLSQNKVANVTAKADISQNNNKVERKDLVGLAAIDALELIDESKWKASPQNGYPLPTPVYYMLYADASDNTGTALTKFVGYQAAKPVDSAYSIRLVAVLDETELANLSSLGFKVTLKYTDETEVTKTLTRELDTVYSSIVANDGTANTVYSAESLGGKYIFALNITDIPTKYESMEISVTTFHVVKGTSEQIDGSTSKVTIHTSSLIGDVK